MTEPVLGVIGGIGAKATFDFCQMLLTRLPAKTNDDYPRMLIDCNPKVPNINAALLGDGPSAAPALAESAGKLQTAGATILVLICNGAHAYEDEIRRAVDIPLINMIETAAERTARLTPPGSASGVLATDGVLKADLFQRALRATGRRPLAPAETALPAFMNALALEEQRDNPERARATIAACIDELRQRGAKALILGCTEIRPMIDRPPADMALVDPLEALADRCARLFGDPRAAACDAVSTRSFE